VVTKPSNIVKLVGDITAYSKLGSRPAQTYSAALLDAWSADKWTLLGIDPNTLSSQDRNDESYLARKGKLTQKHLCQVAALYAIAAENLMSRAFQGNTYYTLLRDFSLGCVADVAVDEYLYTDRNVAGSFNRGSVIERGAGNRLSLTREGDSRPRSRSVTMCLLNDGNHFEPVLVGGDDTPAESLTNVANFFTHYGRNGATSLWAKTTYFDVCSTGGAPTGEKRQKM